jgi:hypothetical protein
MGNSICRITEVQKQLFPSWHDNFLFAELVLKNLSNSPHRQEVMLVERGIKCYRY